MLRLSRAHEWMKSQLFQSSCSACLWSYEHAWKRSLSKRIEAVAYYSRSYDLTSTLGNKRNVRLRIKEFKITIRHCDVWVFWDQSWRVVNRVLSIYVIEGLELMWVDTSSCYNSATTSCNSQVSNSSAFTLSICTSISTQLILSKLCQIFGQKTRDHRNESCGH